MDRLTQQLEASRSRRSDDRRGVAVDWEGAAVDFELFQAGARHGQDVCYHVTPQSEPVLATQGQVLAIRKDAGS